MRLGLFLFLLGLFFKGETQCGLAKTYIIDDIDNEGPDTTNISLIVAGAINNSLSAPLQGLCGVQLRFRHPFMKELFIELISPAGEKITLVGGDIVATNTPLITWNVTFIPCSASPAPDPGFLGKWENDQLWQSLTTYTGQYHPYIGCLEDFNIGTVNGTWTLRCIDFEDSGKGTLLNAQLIFCQDQGISCSECLLNPGIISNSDLTKCQGDNDLAIQLNKSFPGNQFNPVLYDYSNIIFKDSFIFDYQQSADLTTASSGIYKICGIQSSKQQASVLPIKGAKYNQVSLEDYFFKQGSCASVSDSCQQVTIVEPILPLNVTKYICKGDSFYINGQSYSNSGMYDVVFDKPVCDSLVRLDLRVVDVSASIRADRDSINCNGNTIALEGSNQGASSGDLTYHWFTNDGLLQGNTNDFIVDVQKSGLYFLEISVSSPEYTCRDTASKEIFVDDSFPDVLLTGDTLTCFNDTIQITFTASKPLVSKIWSSNDLFPISETSDGIKVWNPGWYFLSGIGDNGCNSLDSIYIDQDKLFTDPVITVDTINCNTDSVMIEVFVDAQRQFTYNWTGVKNIYTNTQNPWVDTSGVYTVLITDAINGCNRFYDVMVEEDTQPPLILNIDTDSITCDRNSVYPIVSSDQDISAYQWLGPGLNTISSAPEILQSGIFSVTVTSIKNGCNASANFEVVKDTIIPQVELNAEMLSCLVDSVFIILNSDSHLAAVTWFGPDNFTSNLLTPKVGTKGTYTVQFMGTNGCTSQNSISVVNSTDIPETVFSIDSLKCGSDTVQVVVVSENGLYSYTWDGPGLVSNNVSNPKLFEPGMYFVTITDVVSTCSSVLEINLVDDRLYTIPDIIVDTLDCLKDSIQVILLNSDIKSAQYTGSGFFSDHLSPYIKNTGTYQYTLINNKNCISTGNFEVYRNDTLPSLDKVFNPIICNRDSLLLHGISSLSGTIFSWSGPSGFMKTGEDVFAYQGGKYTLEGFAPNGCKSLITFDVGYDTIHPVFQILDADTLTCKKPSVNLNTNFNTDQGTLIWLPVGLSGNGVSVTTPGQYIAEVRGTNNCLNRDTVYVFEKKNFPAFQASASVITCKDILSSINIVPTSPYKEINWANDINPESIANGQLNYNTSFDGLYRFTITNEEECSVVGEVAVTKDVDPPQILSYITDTLDCDHPEIKIGVELNQTALEYLWNGPGVLDQITNGLLLISKEGTYYLKITGGNYCVTNETFNIFKTTDLPLYSVFTDTLTCDKGKVNIGIIPISEIQSYHWSGPDNFESNLRNPKVFLSGNYTVTVTGENGCTSVSVIDVDEDVTIPIISIRDTFLIPCDSSLLMLNVTADQEIVKYKWVFPSGDILSDVSPLTNTVGNYFIQVKGYNGCASTNKQFYIGLDTRPPGFNVTTDTITCAQPVATLKATSNEIDVLYRWVTPTGLGSDGSSFSTSEGGIYLLIVSNSNKCKDSVMIEVMVDTTKAQIIVDKKGDIQCEIKRVVLDASATEVPDNFKVTWSSNTGNIIRQVNDFIIEVDMAGNYLVQIENLSNGCISNENIGISETPQQFSQIDIESNPPDCDLVRNGKISLTGFNSIGPFMVALNGTDRNGQTEFFNLSPGVYRFEVKDSLGCKVNEVVTLGQGANLQLDIESEILILFGDSVLLNPSFTPDPNGMAVMKWYVRDSLICSGCTELWIRPFVNTIYSIEYDINGQCKEVVSVLVKVKNDIDKAIPNIFLPSSTSGNNRFFIPQIRGIDKIRYIRIFDRWAENVYSAIDLLPGDAESGWDGTFNGKEVMPGVFVVFVELLLSDGTIWKYQGDVTVLR